MSGELPRAKKSLGQHWLSDEAALQAMCDAAGVTASDTVLEIGPGAGTLTAKLVERAREVVAVEFDKSLAIELPQKIHAENLSVVHEDILRFDLTTLPPDYKVVANIPYYLTSKLLRVLSESSNPPAIIALLIQKEVAERVAATPGDMSLLSASVQYYYEPELQRLVPADLFTPPPKVDSQIISLKRRVTPLFSGINSNQFFQIVKAGFSARRKTLLNSLAGGLRLDKSRVGEIISTAGLSPTTRPQELGLEDWYSLYQAYQGTDNNT